MSDLVEILRDHATDWNGEQMPDLEPAKADPTAGTLRAAANRIEALEAALSASLGYLMNARVDLETGCTKATAIRTIDGGIKRVKAALTPDDREVG